MYGNVPAFQPRGFSPEPPSRLEMSRPSAKSIYMQRREYSESIKKQPDTFQYRVEHLITCELDRLELSTVDDCVARLKTLDSRGKVWGQDMILQVQGSSLQLCDIETKEVLDSLYLSSISQTKAVSGAGVYDSLLAVTVQENRRPPSVFLFQCEETRAEEIRGELERARQNRGEDLGFQPSEPLFDIRTNLENIIGQGYSGGFRKPGPPPMQHAPPPPEYLPPPPNSYQDYDAAAFIPREELRYSPDMQEQQRQPSPAPNNFIDRSAEIFNHVVGDIEIFTGKVEDAVDQEEGGKQKKKKGKTQRKYGQNFPSIQEYISCLQKFKYAFNLLAKLDGHLKEPSAPELVHTLFSSLGSLAMQFPPDVPQSVLSPFLTEGALRLLSLVVTPQEERLWSSFGDTWNVPRSKWPNGDKMAPYIPEFYDGWELPMPAPPQTGPVTPTPSRSNSQRFPPRNGPQQPPAQDNRPFGFPPTRSEGLSLYTRVIYDFTARNRQELSVLKGEVVQVVDKSRQWWIVRNNRQEEGHVPPNVLEPMGGEEPSRMNRTPNLDMRSSPEEVRAWLQYKGFSKTTVRNLGVMNGALLLGLRRDDIRVVCPEEGGRVFFQLQAIKSALALASEAEYNQLGGR